MSVFTMHYREISKIILLVTPFLPSSYKHAILLRYVYSLVLNQTDLVGKNPPLKMTDFTALA